MLFRYVAYTLEHGVVRGRLEARTEMEARTELVQQGQKPLLLKPLSGPRHLEDLVPSLFGVSSAELARFSRSLATIISASGYLLRALETIQSGSSNRAMRRILERVRSSIEAGSGLSEALREHPTTFSPLYISVVEVGEYTGHLAPALEQMADILGQEQEAKQKAIKTMLYPAAIIGLAVITMAIMLTVAMPPMLKVFENMGAELPLITRVTVMASGGLKTNFHLFLLAGVAMVGMVVLLRRTPRTKYWIDSTLVRTPLFGSLTVTTELSRFARTTAMLLEAGVPLATTLRLAINGCRNWALRRALSSTEESLIRGDELAAALRGYEILPAMFLEMVAIGEDSNALQHTMKDAAAIYQKQADQRLDTMLGILEPASTLFVGGIVGLLAFSMFLPIYSGINVFR